MVICDSSVSANRIRTAPPCPLAFSRTGRVLFSSLQLAELLKNTQFSIVITAERPREKKVKAPAVVILS